jgi:hypothetical protein
VPAPKVGADWPAGYWHDQPVAEPLLVPLPVVVRRELVERTDEAPFAEQDQSVQALLTNRPHEPLRVGVGVRRLERRQDHAHACPFQKASESGRPLAVPVADQHPMARQEPIDSVC